MSEIVKANWRASGHADVLRMALNIVTSDTLAQ